MSADHKAALAEGRRQGSVVSAYLEAIEASKPRRGRRRTPETIERRLESIDTELLDAIPTRRLELLQQRRELVRELQTSGDTIDLDTLEKEFIDVAAPYSERKGIEYATWREAGVPAAVLRAAGIRRGASS